MFEVQGNVNTARVYAPELESSAIGQVIALCNIDTFKDSKIRLMPDAHAGKGCVVGTTMTFNDTIVPNLVGVDIACGLLVVELDSEYIDFQKLDKVIRENVPCGFSVRNKEHRFNNEISLEDLYCFNSVNRQKARLSIGTLGGGNHFIEIDKNLHSNKFFLVIHTGSRHIGHQVAEFYQKRAGSYRDHRVPYELSSLSPEDTNKYLHDMDIMINYANLNRCAIADEILKKMKWKKKNSFTTIHNYIDTKNHILRKGAISAQDGELSIIPLNMRDGSLICYGKGNPEWNFSAPHGAGRICSRNDAKKRFTLTEFKSTMNGVYSSCISHGTIDESPMAYKPFEMITNYISDTVSVVCRILPVYNFKAGSK